MAMVAVTVADSSETAQLGGSLPCRNEYNNTNMAIRPQPKIKIAAIRNAMPEAGLLMRNKCRYFLVIDNDNIGLMVHQSASQSYLRPTNSRSMR